MRIARGHRWRAKAIAVLAAASLLATAGAADAELTANGDLFVTFNGGISPAALPRHDFAPIAVWVGGRVRTLSGQHPPALREMTIALNRKGRIDTRGLPVCHLRQIQALSSARALSVCGAALVGSGKYIAKTAFPEQRPTPSSGRILAFNTKVQGRPAILAHVYGTNPVPSTRIIVFHIRNEANGEFGTVMTGALSQAANRWGYVKRISLALHRNFIYRGRQHSYLSAVCPAPAGLRQASFPFAFASMTFSDGRTLSSTIVRTCKVK